MSQVIIIGGGLAGLASAVALSDAGLQVDLYERRPILGGRASSFIHPSSGEQVDNCQHVLLGCCVNLVDFYTRLGVANHIAFQKTIPFIDESNTVSIIGSSFLPPPLHLFPSFLRLRSIGFADKLSIIRTVYSMVRYILRKRAADPEKLLFLGSMETWLKSHGASSRAIEAFWKPFLISALNDELDDIDADYGITTSVRTFLINRRSYEVGLPAVPLSDLYKPSIDYIEQRGGRVLLNQGVSAISCNGENVTSITLQDGSSVEAETYLSALPSDILCRLLPENHVSNSYFSMLKGLSVSPITAVHLWFDRTVTTLDYAAVIGRRIQWIFNQSIRDPGTFTSETSGTYLGLVVSASDDWMKLPRQQIINQVMEDLRSLLPTVCKAKLIKAIVIKEGRATFAPKPGADSLRPTPSCPLSNLFIAGDWVQTGWPATMESAVRSGYQATETLLESLGNPARFLKPELPAQGLLRWVMGQQGF